MNQKHTSGYQHKAEAEHQEQTVVVDTKLLIVVVVVNTIVV